MERKLPACIMGRGHPARVFCNSYRTGWKPVRHNAGKMPAFHDGRGCIVGSFFEFGVQITGGGYIFDSNSVRFE
jgi:hypothetical protein